MANYHVSKDKESGNGISKKKGIPDPVVLRPHKKLEKLQKNNSANSGGGEVRINGLNGKIRGSDTVAHGNDPSNIKDTEH